MEVKNYDLDFQRYILTQIVNASDIFARCKNILNPDYFHPSLRGSVIFIKDYSYEYDALPTIENILVKTGTEFKESPVNVIHRESILNDISEFCKHKAIEGAIIAGGNLLTEKRYGEIEELIKKAMMVSLQTDMGIDAFENPYSIIESLAATQGTFKTGYQTLDFKLFGGFGKQELEIFVAASGGGKSVMMQNLAVNFANQGYNGVYITLELAEDLISVRLYSMVTGIPPADIKRNPEYASKKVTIETAKGGKLRVKRLPESITTVNDIEAFLHEYMIQTGIKLDYICVDYLDLLTSDRCRDQSNVFLKDKLVAEELRGLAHKMDFTVISACQFNRSGIGSEEKSQNQIAGGISKIYTADNVIYLDAKRERGEMILDFQKTRNSSAVGSTLRMAYNIDTLRITDHENTILDYQSKFSQFKWVGDMPVHNVTEDRNNTFNALKAKMTNHQNNTNTIEIEKEPEHESVDDTRVLAAINNHSSSNTINTRNVSTEKNASIRDFLKNVR